MKTLIVSDSKCDFVDVLEGCGAETECIEFQKVLTVNLEDYDSFCILPEESGAYLEARFREKLEKEAGKGKKIFLQAIRGFQDILCGESFEDFNNTLEGKLNNCQKDINSYLSSLKDFKKS